MSDQYIGEIRMFGGNFAPTGWLFCEGQLLQIAQFQELFALVGTSYGGDGTTTFGLPDLRGQLPVHFGSNGTSSYAVAQTFGSEMVTLMTSNLPSHGHALPVSSQPGTALSPSAAYFAASAAQNVGYAATSDGQMGGALFSTTGNQPHDNRQPFLCVSFIIATTGNYPTPT